METKQTKSRNYTRALTTAALMIALSMILSQIKIFEMPQGGSVTLFGMLPVILIGYLLGVRWGIIGGGVLGILNLIFGGYVIHPVQLFIDYILAFAVLGLSGLTRNSKHALTSGYLIAIFSRYICAVISGIVFFGEYAPKGFNAVTWSLWYNITYIVAEGLITIILINIPAIKKLFARLRLSLES